VQVTDSRPVSVPVRGYACPPFSCNASHPSLSPKVCPTWLLASRCLRVPFLVCQWACRANPLHFVPRSLVTHIFFFWPPHLSCALFPRTNVSFRVDRRSLQECLIHPLVSRNAGVTVSFWPPVVLFFPPAYGLWWGAFETSWFFFFLAFFQMGIFCSGFHAFLGVRSFNKLLFLQKGQEVLGPPKVFWDPRPTVLFALISYFFHPVFWELEAPPKSRMLRFIPPVTWFLFLTSLILISESPIGPEGRLGYPRQISWHCFHTFSVPPPDFPFFWPTETPVGSLRDPLPPP